MDRAQLLSDAGGWKHRKMLETSPTASGICLSELSPDGLELHGPGMVTCKTLVPRAIFIPFLSRDTDVESVGSYGILPL